MTNLDLHVYQTRDGGWGARVSGSDAQGNQQGVTFTGFTEPGQAAKAATQRFLCLMRNWNDFEKIEPYPLPQP